HDLVLLSWSVVKRPGLSVVRKVAGSDAETWNSSPAPDGLENEKQKLGMTRVPHEINRLYPESRRKDEKEDRYLNSPTGGSSGRTRTKPRVTLTRVGREVVVEEQGRRGAPK
ncbi:hypothetical protein TNCV_4446701, partial [Trichonephila clavipes]